MNDLQLEQLFAASVLEEDWETAQLCDEALNGNARQADRALESLAERKVVRRGYLARQVDAIVSLMTGTGRN